MSYATITKILDAHGIKTRTNSRGEFQAEDVYTIRRGNVTRAGRKWKNVDGWTRCQLFNWLGY